MQAAAAHWCVGRHAHQPHHCSQRRASLSAFPSQEERNVCLAAATRADALLVKLGQHALLTRGVD